MPKLRVHCFSLSLDGCGAGPDQDIANPLGRGGLALHEWLFQTRTWQRTHGKAVGASGIDDDFVARGADNVGAWIMGRNMFGPVRGPWREPRWNGWWRDDPPFHAPVFVLTHYPREPVALGDTTFHFVTEGMHGALECAMEAACGRDVRIGGGVATIRQYLRERLIDEMHLAIAPVLLGIGEPLLAGLDLPALGYACVEQLRSPRATHVVIAKRP